MGYCALPRQALARVGKSVLNLALGTSFYPRNRVLMRGIPNSREVGWCKQTYLVRPNTHNFAIPGVKHFQLVAEGLLQNTFYPGLPVPSHSCCARSRESRQRMEVEVVNGGIGAPSSAGKGDKDQQSRPCRSISSYVIQDFRRAVGTHGVGVGGFELARSFGLTRVLRLRWMMGEEQQPC